MATATAEGSIHLHAPDAYRRVDVEWADSMTPLVPEKMELWEQILYWVLEIIRFIPRLILQEITKSFVAEIADPVLNPELQRLNVAFQRTLSDISGPFIVEPFALTLPDGKEIKGTFYRDSRAHHNTDVPTILRFGGLGECQAAHPPLEALRAIEAQDEPMHFVTFDYPIVGENAHLPICRENVMLTTLAIFDYVNQHYGIPSDFIHFWGMSLGGAMALQTEQYLPDHNGLIFCDRTFGNTKEMMTRMFGDFWGTLAYIFAWILGQDLASDEILKNLTGGRVRVMNLGTDSRSTNEDHELDQIIPTTHSLFEKHVANPQLDLQYLRLLPSHEGQLNDNLHCASLQDLRMEGRTGDALGWMIQEIAQAAAHSRLALFQGTG